MANKKPVKIKEYLDNHVVVFFLGTAAAAFGAGFLSRGYVQIPSYEKVLEERDQRDKNIQTLRGQVTALEKQVADSKSSPPIVVIDSPFRQTATEAMIGHLAHLSRPLDDSG